MKELPLEGISALMAFLVIGILFAQDLTGKNFGRGRWAIFGNPNILVDALNGRMNYPTFRFLVWLGYAAVVFVFIAVRRRSQK